MLFNSVPFLCIFLPIFLLIYGRLRSRQKPRLLWILLASGIFYLFAGAEYLVLLVGMATATFLISRTLLESDKDTRRRLGLLLSMGNLGLLGLFKYGAFAAGTLNGLAEVVGLRVSLPVIQQILPLGMSFFTFNLVSYSVDTYQQRNPPARSLVQFLAYVTFFPSIASGPLMRYGEFRSQSRSLHQGDLRPPQVDEGLHGIVIGLAKKLLIADRIALIISPHLGAGSELGFWGSWLVILGFHFQVYYDFSGYTDIAIGVGKLLDVRLPRNFDSPYTARNAADFWRRWHITLSNWFRDYLFLPLSRGLLKREWIANRDLVRAISFIATMALTGLWHGANWTFVIWGVYQGVLLTAHAQWHSARLRPWPVLLSRAGMTLALLLGWVMFRADSLSSAVGQYKSMLGLGGFEGGFQSVPPDLRAAPFLALMLLLLMATNLPYDTWSMRPRRHWLYIVGMALLLALSILHMGQPMPFYYFQF